MRIEAYIIMWNEEKLLPFVLKHYAKFCSKITCYDNYSSDSSVSIAESFGCTVVPFGLRGKLDDQSYLDVKNHCWKKSDADYVIVCDADEVLWAGDDLNLKIVLQNGCLRGIKMFKTRGWSIYSDPFPIDNIDDVTRGVDDPAYSKSIIFDPKAFHEINYRPGAHRCDPMPKIIEPPHEFDLPLYVLHYRKMGGFEAYMKRVREYGKRMSPRNRMKGWGLHYLFGEQKIFNKYREADKQATKLVYR